MDKRVTKKNIEFHETLTSAMPLAPSLRGLSNDQMRVVLVVIWVSAVILAGVGIGMWITALSSATSTAPGFPVASAKVAITTLATESAQNVSQSTAGPDALTPGLVQDNRVQGNIGTKPVR